MYNVYNVKTLYAAPECISIIKVYLINFYYRSTEHFKLSCFEHI